MKSIFKRILSSPVFITGFAFALRMVLMYVQSHVGPNPVRTDTPYGYELGRVARAIAAGLGFSSPLRMVDTGPTVWFTPIYPYFVAGIFKLFGIYSYLSEIIIQISNSAFAALTVIPIHAIAKKTYGNGVAMGAAWGWVFFPTALFFPIMWIWDTALAALFFALIFWATLALREKRNLLPWMGYGALWALGGLTNPSLLSLLPFFLGWLIWEAHKESAPWARSLTAALLVFTICLVPWMIRNYRVFDKLIVLRSNFGLELWLGNNPDVTDTMSQWKHPNDNPAEAEKYKSMGEIAYMAEKQHEAFAYMRSHPLDTINFMFRRFVENWLGITDSPADVWAYVPLYVKAFLAMNCLFSIFSFLGVLYLSRARQGEGLLFASVLLVFPLVFYFTHSSLRYRFPIDPIMMVLVAGAFGHLLSLARNPSSNETKMAMSASSIMAGSPSGFRVNK
jgi:4-amino-4-deoxy-L-arabinose transferase-like glycosyltransferase